MDHTARRVGAVAAVWLGLAACSSGGKTDPEKTGKVTAGTCDCCGHIVDVAGQPCDDPQVCAAACADSGSDGASDASNDR